jgi:hypothetical protein
MHSAVEEYEANEHYFRYFTGIITKNRERVRDAYNKKRGMNKNVI